MSSPAKPVSLMQPTLLVVLLTPVLLTLAGMATGIVGLMMPAEVSSASWFRLFASGANTVLGMGAMGWILSALAEPDPVGSADAGDGDPAGRRGPWFPLAAALVTGVLLALVVNPLVTWVMELLGDLPGWLLWRGQVLEELLSSVDPLSLAAQAVGLCVAPALLEEWVFRRQYGRLLAELRWSRQALLSGGTFAAVHLDVLMFVPLVVVGIVFWAVARRAGWLAAAFAHCAFNATGVFLWYRVEPLVEWRYVLPLVALVSGALLAGWWRATGPSDGLS